MNSPRKIKGYSKNNRNLTREDVRWLSGPATIGGHTLTS